MAKIIPIGTPVNDSERRAIETVLEGFSSMQDVAKMVLVAGCTDQAFARFKNALRTWFPKEGA